MVDGFKDLAGAGEGAGCVEAFDEHANPLDDHLGIERREETGKGQGRKGTGRDGKGRDGKGREETGREGTGDAMAEGRGRGSGRGRVLIRASQIHECNIQYTIYNMRYSV